MTPARILLLSDEVGGSSALQTWVTALGHIALGPASDAASVLQIAEREHPDLALLAFPHADTPSESNALTAVCRQLNLPVVSLKHPCEQNLLAALIELALNRHRAACEALPSDRSTARHEQSDQLEAQLLRAQQLESLGVLTAGIAHDFNNLLTGILGYTSLAADQLPPESPVRALLHEAEKAASRAADLVHQLLVQVGIGRQPPQPVDLTLLVREMAVLLRTMVPRKTTLDINLHDSLPLVQADLTQLRQLLINLICNALESLTNGGGNVTLATGSSTLDSPNPPADVTLGQFQPGIYAFVEVSDSGQGMSRETLQRAFDPFFSTRSNGRGLGLTAVQWIAQSHRAVVQVATSPGRGTTIRIHFPTVSTPGATDSPSVTARPPEPPPPHADPSGTILVVDDDTSVRSFAAHVLQKAGFRVLTAENGEAAVAAVQSASSPFRLVLLDLSMPGMDGTAAAEIIHRLQPTLPIILMSGYTEPQVASVASQSSIASYLHKPFVGDQLLQRIDEVLDRTSR